MFKKFWKIILVIFIIICIFFVPIAAALGPWLVANGWPLLGAFLQTAAATMPWWAGAAVGLGLAYTVDPDTTTEIIEDLGKVAGTVGGAVVGAVTSTVGAALGSTPVLLLGLGILAFYLFRSRSDDDAEPTPPAVSSATEKGVSNGTQSA